MTPSVRGRRRVEVAVVLLGTAAASGALVGWALGVAWLVARLPAAGAPAAVAVAGAAVAADLAWRRGRGRGPKPPAVGTQVPQAWGRLFDPRTAAALYGARLGVGPLTILRTWTWWAAAVLGASAGPVAGAVTGATFGAVRIAVVLAASAVAATPAGMAALRRREAPVAGVLMALALGAAGAAALA